MATYYSASLMDLYEREEPDRKISYERFVKNLGKQVFLELREILGIDLEPPKRFYTIHGHNNHPERVPKEKGHDPNNSITVGQISYNVDTNVLSRVIKINKVRIGFTVWYDMTLKSFIECTGHEMVHYYDLVYNKKYPLYHKRAFKKIMRKWNKKLKPHGIEIKEYCNVLNRIHI